MKAIQSILIIISLIVVIIRAEYTKDENADLQKVCLDKSGLSKETLTKVKKGEIDDEPETGKYLLCAFRYSGIFNENDEYHTENMKLFLLDAFDKDKAKKIIDDCTTPTNLRGVEAAVQFAKCYHKHASKHTF